MSHGDNGLISRGFTSASHKRTETRVNRELGGMDGTVEIERLAALDELQVLDTASEPLFDSLTELAARGAVSITHSDPNR